MFPNRGPISFGSFQNLVIRIGDFYDLFIDAEGFNQMVKVKESQLEDVVVSVLVTVLTLYDQSPEQKTHYFPLFFLFPFHYFPVIFYDGRFCTKRACQCHCLFCTYKTRKPCSIHLIDTTSSRKYFSVIKHLDFPFFCYFFMRSDTSHQSCKNYIVQQWVLLSLGSVKMYLFICKTSHPLQNMKQ